jgi:hypothetical protein
MKRNGKTPTPTERRIELSPIEQELVRVAVAENETAKAVADSALAGRLAPIRAHYKLPAGARADFRPTKDGKQIVMTVFEAAT